MKQVTSWKKYEHLFDIHIVFFFFMLVNEDSIELCRCRRRINFQTKKMKKCFCFVLLICSRSSCTCVDKDTFLQGSTEAAFFHIRPKPNNVQLQRNFGLYVFCLRFLIFFSETQNRERDIGCCRLGKKQPGLKTTRDIVPKKYLSFLSFEHGLCIKEIGREIICQRIPRITRRRRCRKTSRRIRHITRKQGASCEC